MKQTSITMYNNRNYLIVILFTYFLWLCVNIERKIFLWGWSSIDIMRRNKCWLPLVLRELIFLDNYRNAFMFIDSSIVLNMDCHIGEFYPSLLRLTLEEGFKLFFIICWIILRWYQATFFIENCAMLKTSCIDLVPRTHAFFIRGDQCKKKKKRNQKSWFRPLDCAEALKFTMVSEHA